MVDNDIRDVTRKIEGCESTTRLDEREATDGDVSDTESLAGSKKSNTSHVGKVIYANMTRKTQRFYNFTVS